MNVTENEIGVAGYVLLALMVISLAKTLNLVSELRKWLRNRKAWRQNGS